MFLVLMINMTQSQGNDDLYSKCSYLFNCGNIQDVGFPFWGGNRPNSCGHPALQLACEDDAASITISNVKYKVLDIDHNSEVLNIAREDFSTGICSPDFTNTTFDPALFSMVRGYSNFTIIYGCPGVPSAGNWFSCARSGRATIYGYWASGARGPGSCSESVVIPVDQNLLSQLAHGLVNLEEPGKQGFEVRLEVDSAACKRCAHSKGVCGYDISKNTTACYCADGSLVSRLRDSRLKVSRLKVSRLRGSLVQKDLAGSLYRLQLKMGVFSWKFPLFKSEKDPDIEKLMGIHGSLVPRRYQYIDLKKMTDSFSKKLGQGGFGAVYKGEIRDVGLVAVKILTESKSSPKEFINEVMRISRTSHVNVITLLGFCYEGKKRALVFEYMPNGSLDKFMYSRKALNMSSSLEWKILYQIAIGIARGLEYLHRGCNTRILHFDIKPQNILLDRDFIPKISNFGLAKLCHRQDSAVSTLGMRGTVGFIALEVVFRNLGRISHKSDVYSYGMLILEMLGFRNSDIIVSNNNDMYFPKWIYGNLEPGKDLKLLMNVLEEEEVLVRKMIIVSLWCIQTSPFDRPPIVNVIEMLEGSLGSLQMLPKPILYPPT
ncbi:hypothetical protein EUGRSUZ_F02096 [Eucalyptus grandis]|uniref:Uncharacterized protein n=2 Tax=Eucalyptus grandis TaxID=71139 RepID=A0ACC3KHH7_EUCGR|nr:hypothetical protein EUGRSUZ_F02096 [Eucalyptus grandis]